MTVLLRSCAASPAEGAAPAVEAGAADGDEGQPPPLSFGWRAASAREARLVDAALASLSEAGEGGGAGGAGGEAWLRRLSRTDVLRFVRARGGQAAEVRALDGVQAALRSTAAWRSDERVDGILDREGALSLETFFALHNDEAGGEAAGAGEARWLRGRDRAGRPTAVFFADRHRPGQIPTETWRRFVVYNAEAAIRDLGVADGPGGQFSLVVDRSSSGVRNQDPALAIAVLPALVQHYPGLLGEVIVAPVNGVFWAVWRVVSLFLGAETRRFTFIRGARWREALLEAVGGDVELPEHMRLAGDGV